MRETLDEYGLKVSSIGSPIGKITIDDEFPPHLERMRHAVEVAKTLEAPYIRLFSFFIPEGTDPDSRRDEVLSRMSALAEVAADADVILVHENEKEIYGDIPRRCLDIVTVGVVAQAAAGLGSGQLRPGRGPPVHRGVRHAAAPCRTTSRSRTRCWPTGRSWSPAPATASCVETVRALRADGFDGFFSLEPHLGEYTAFGALSGPELFTQAWQGLHRHSHQRRDRVRMSSPSSSPTTGSGSPLSVPGLSARIHGAVISELADQIELVAVVDVHLRAGRDAGRRAWREGLHAP